MPTRLPLFPLSMVLLPGSMLPLHVFEERYRVMVQDLLLLPEAERRFGVVAIRQGREVGEDGVQALHEVGCVARVRQLQAHEDGRYALIATGAERFRLVGTATDRPYLTGLVEELPDDVGDPDEARLLAAAVRAALPPYLEALGRASGQELVVDRLPPDPLVLGHGVAASLRVDLSERQRLLECVDGTERLRAELALLRRETVLLQQLRAAPAPELTRASISPN